MKNLRFHLIYLAIIGFLTYQYWTKTQALEEAVRSIEMFDKVLERDNKSVNETIQQLFTSIGKQTQAYMTQTNIRFFGNAQDVTEQCQILNAFFEKLKTEYILNEGGKYNKDTFYLANGISNGASKRYFSKQKVEQIKDSLNKLQVILSNISDTVEKYRFQHNSLTKLILEDDINWKAYKNRTVSENMAHLTAIQNYILSDNRLFLNYISKQIGGTGIIEDYFHVAIAPRKASIIVGETFEADSYLAKYSSYYGSNITFFIDGKEVPVNYGIAHFSTQPQDIGTKKMNVEVHIRNPLTGMVFKQFGEFEYEVLPKCAKNCQQNK